MLCLFCLLAVSFYFYGGLRFASFAYNCCGTNRSALSQTRDLFSTWKIQKALWSLTRSTFQKLLNNAQRCVAEWPPKWTNSCWLSFFRFRWPLLNQSYIIAENVGIEFVANTERFDLSWSTPADRLMNRTACNGSIHEARTNFRSGS